MYICIYVYMLQYKRDIGANAKTPVEPHLHTIVFL